MKKIQLLASALALFLLATGAQAQKPTNPNMAGKAGGGMRGKPLSESAKKAGVSGTTAGTVKGSPTAASFVISTAKGDKTVNATGAKYRNATGQFVKADKLTGGASVEVTGTWKGKTLWADNVKILSIKQNGPPTGKGSSRPKGGTAGAK